jgi:hypothetical protein
MYFLFLELSQAQKHLADVLHDFKLGMVGTMSEDDLVCK